MLKTTIILMVLAIILISCASPSSQPSIEPIFTLTKTLPPPTETSEPTLTATVTGGDVTVFWQELPQGLEYRLTDADKEMLDIDSTGDGFAISIVHRGISINFAVVVSNRFLELTDGKGPTLKKDYPEAKGSPIERIAEAILLGHWGGWVQDYGEITFEEFVARLATGEDMRYKVMGASTVDNITGIITVDPAKPLEYVVQITGETDNGNKWIKSTNPIFGYGFYIKPDGTFRLIRFQADEKGVPGSTHYGMNSGFVPTLYILSLPENEQRRSLENSATYDNQSELYQVIRKQIFYKNSNDPSFKFTDVVFVPQD